MSAERSGFRWLWRTVFFTLMLKLKFSISSSGLAGVTVGENWFVMFLGLKGGVIDCTDLWNFVWANQILKILFNSYSLIQVFVLLTKISNYGIV